MSYNEEEVKELFEVVFKLSAKDVNDKLIKVRNRPEIAKRRWFWELLQNAKDAVRPNEKVRVKLIFGSNNEKNFVEFQHNGNPFRYQDAKNLIFPYSDKEEEYNSDKSGRFGTGFLATHILSKKIHVEGIYQKDAEAFNFKFVLDRSGTDKTEIAESVNVTWQEFRDKRIVLPGYKHNSINFETSFKYILEENNANLVAESVIEFGPSLPFALAFISKIQSVTIIDEVDQSNTTYETVADLEKQLTNNIKQIVVEKKVLNNEGNSKFVTLIICSDGVIDVALEVCNINDKVFIKEFSENQPLLFCPFPLIGSNEFKFPVIINSTSFLPKEERDGIWLADTSSEGKINQQLLERVVPLFRALTIYASDQNWQNSFLLFKTLKDNLVIADFNNDWFKKSIQSVIKSHIKTIPLVDTQTGERMAISLNNKFVYFPSDAKEEIRLQLWDFANSLFPRNLPQKKHLNDWYNVIWDDCPSLTIKSFAKLVAGYKTIDALQVALNLTRNDALEWLNKFVAFLTREEASLLNLADYQILPNQFGFFKRKDELYLDDDSIDQELKEILADISKLTSKVEDWRKDMLDKKIFLELPSTRTITAIGSIISDIVKELLKEENPTNQLRDLFSRLLNWLNENPDKSKNYFKSLKTETLLYKTANETKIKHITDLLQKDRDGYISVELLANIDSAKILLLQDPELALKVRLGEEVLANLQKEKEDFAFKKKLGDIFEDIFYSLVSEEAVLKIQKVDGEEDFVIINTITSKHFYVELKSVSDSESQINMTHKQGKKANLYPDRYFLCIIPNNGSTIDRDYFLKYARFDSLIGAKLANKVVEALAFEAPSNGIRVEFEDSLLNLYNKYRYKFSVQSLLWGNDDFGAFKRKLLL